MPFLGQRASHPGSLCLGASSRWSPSPWRRRPAGAGRSRVDGAGSLFPLCRQLRRQKRARPAAGCLLARRGPGAEAAAPAGDVLRRVPRCAPCVTGSSPAGRCRQALPHRRGGDWRLGCAFITHTHTRARARVHGARQGEGTEAAPGERRSGGGGGGGVLGERGREHWRPGVPRRRALAAVHASSLLELHEEGALAAHLLLQLEQAVEEGLRGGRAAGHVQVHRHDACGRRGGVGGGREARVQRLAGGSGCQSASGLAPAWGGQRRTGAARPGRCQAALSGHRSTHGHTRAPPRTSSGSIPRRWRRSPWRAPTAGPASGRTPCGAQAPSCS